MNKSQPRDRCYICGNDNPTVLQTHHIVPRRHGGTDSEENLVRLCANCHQSVESMYDRRFYKKMSSNISPDQVWNKQDVDPDRNPVAAFIEEAVAPTGIGEHTHKTELYKAFNAFLRKHNQEQWNFDQKPDQTTFANRFKEAFPEEVENKKRKGEYAFIGVAMTSSGEELLNDAREVGSSPNTTPTTTAERPNEQ